MNALLNSSSHTPLRSADTAKSQRSASLVAGLALALMAVLSGFGVFGAIQPSITPGNAEATAAAILGSELMFRLGIASLILVIVLDVIAASALYTVFAPVNQSLSRMAAWFRLAYSVVFLVAILQLPIAVSLLAEPVAALRAIEAFYTIWYIGLILFGFHLLLIGYLAFRSGFMAKVFGILLILAGIGYAVDGFGLVIIPDFTAFLGQFLFVGEVVLIFWLLIRGRRLTN